MEQALPVSQDSNQQSQDILSLPQSEDEYWYEIIFENCNINNIDDNSHYTPYKLINIGLNYLCEIASWNGCLNVLKYLHENGCPWNEICCENASRPVKYLKYLHENGCPWNKLCCENASWKDFDGSERFRYSERFR